MSGSNPLRDASQSIDRAIELTDSLVADLAVLARREKENAEQAALRDRLLVAIVPAMLLSHTQCQKTLEPVNVVIDSFALLEAVMVEREHRLKAKP